MAGPSKVAMMSLVRSGRGGRVSKEATKFQFDIHIESVHGTSGGPYAIKWTRGVKVAHTKSFETEKNSQVSVRLDQKLSLICTLYRAKPSPGPKSTLHVYDEKDSKLCLVSQKAGKKGEKTTGKAHFDLAQYAGVPSATTRETFKLNGKVSIDCSITCTYIRISKGTASSMGSGLSGISGASSGEEDRAGEHFADPNTGLDDLDGANGLNYSLTSPTTPHMEENSISPGGDSSAAGVQRRHRGFGSFLKGKERAVSATSPSSAAIQTAANKKGLSINPPGSSTGASFKGKSPVASLEDEHEKLEVAEEPTLSETTAIFKERGADSKPFGSSNAPSMKGKSNTELSDLREVKTDLDGDSLSPMRPATDSAESPLQHRKFGSFLKRKDKTLAADGPPSLTKDMAPKKRGLSIRPSGSSTVKSLNGKSTMADLENENEKLRKDLSAAKEDTEKLKALHGMSEDMIRELREKMEYSSGDAHMDSKASEIKELQVAAEDMKRRLAFVTGQANLASEKHEERIKELCSQIETIERGKARLARDVVTASEERDALKQALEAKPSSSADIKFAFEAQNKLQLQIEELRETHEATSIKLQAAREWNATLVEQSRALKDEETRLTARIVAREEHTKSLQSSYEELSTIHAELNEKYAQVLLDPTQTLHGALSSLNPPKNGSRSFSNTSIFRSRRSKGSAKGIDTAAVSSDKRGKCAGNENDTVCVAVDLQTMNSDLQQARHNFTGIKQELLDTQHQKACVEADLISAQSRMESSASKLAVLQIQHDSIKAKYLEVCEELELSNNSNQAIQKQCVTLEQVHREEMEQMSASKTLADHDAADATARSETHSAEIKRLQNVIQDLELKIQDAAKSKTNNAATARMYLEESDSRAGAYEKEIERLQITIADLTQKLSLALEKRGTADEAAEARVNSLLADMRNASDREQTYVREIERKNQTIADLTEKLSKETTNAAHASSEAATKSFAYEEAVLEARTVRAELESKRLRGETYQEEINGMQDTIEDLTRKLRDRTTNSRTALDAAQKQATLAQTELKYAATRQTAYEEEIICLKSIIDGLHADLHESVNKAALSAAAASTELSDARAAAKVAAEVEGSLKDAGSREASYQADIKSMKIVIEDLSSQLSQIERSSAVAAAAADSHTTATESALKAMLLREKAYKGELAEKKEVIAQLTSRLNDAVESARVAEAKAAHSVEEIERAITESSHRDSSLKHTEALTQSQRTELNRMEAVIGTLNEQLSASNRSMDIATAAAVADATAAQADLEDAASREKTYKEEIQRKKRIIEDLTSQLRQETEKNVAHAVHHEVEFNSAKARETSLKEEVNHRKQMTEDLKLRLSEAKRNGVEAAAEAEAELADANSRELAYKSEISRLKLLAETLVAQIEKKPDESKAARGDRGQISPAGMDLGQAPGIVKDAMVSDHSPGHFLSSSSIRKHDMFVMITDDRLLDMLVDTKMKLAVAEEGKLQLEHLIRRVRAGDKHIQQKLAEHASKLEVRLTEANRVISDLEPESQQNGQEPTSRRQSARDGDQCVQNTTFDHSMPQRRTSNQSHTQGVNQSEGSEFDEDVSEPDSDSGPGGG